MVISIEYLNKSNSIIELNKDNYKLAEAALTALFEMAQNTYNLQLRTVAVEIKVNLPINNKTLLIYLFKSNYTEINK